MSAKELYDDIADLYHLIYGDWNATMRGQGEILDRVLRDALSAGPLRIVDASCGIGTQSLGLALLGHAVEGSDVSQRALARARREAAGLGLEVPFSAGDMRACDRHHEGPVDAVISCDNSVPHLLTDGDIVEAFEAFRRCLRSGGAALISVRDYAKEERTTPQLRPFGIRSSPEGRYAVFQVWDWDEDGEHYEFAMHFVRLDQERPQVLVSRARYYAIDTDRLSELFRRAGFRSVERIDGVYFQPLLLALAE